MSTRYVDLVNDLFSELHWDFNNKSMHEPQWQLMDWTTKIGPPPPLIALGKMTNIGYRVEPLRSVFKPPIVLIEPPRPHKKSKEE